MEGAMEDQLRGNNVYTVRQRDFRMYCSYRHDGCINAQACKIKGFQHQLHLLAVKTAGKQETQALNSLHIASAELERVVSEALIQRFGFFCSLSSTTDNHRSFLLVAFIFSKDRGKILFPKAHKHKLQPKEDEEEQWITNVCINSTRFFPQHLSIYMFILEASAFSS